MGGTENETENTKKKGGVCWPARQKCIILRSSTPVQ